MFSRLFARISFPCLPHTRFCSPRLAYPAGAGSTAVRRTMLPSGPLVR
jgi:hypothetical protein